MAIVEHAVGFLGVACCTLANGMLLGEILAQEGAPTTPTTILGAFILVSIGMFSLLGWVVRTLFQLLQSQQTLWQSYMEMKVKQHQEVMDALHSLGYQDGKSSK